MTAHDVVRHLLAQHGTTYADAAGITLRDKPAPLFQLLVLATLSATRIRADTAVGAARELFAAGLRTPERMREARWQERVELLGRSGYRRYDESTASTLGETAEHTLSRHGGDLRELRPRTHADVGSLEHSLTQFPRVGQTGAAIFCREVQVVWPSVRPYFDHKALASARAHGLPGDPVELGALAPRGRVAQLAAALVRAAAR